MQREKKLFSPVVGNLKAGMAIVPQARSMDSFQSKIVVNAKYADVEREVNAKAVMRSVQPSALVPF